MFKTENLNFVSSDKFHFMIYDELSKMNCKHRNRLYSTFL